MHLIPHSRSFFLALILAVAATGCRVSASASGKVNSGGDANTQANLNAESAADTTAASKPIQYRAGQLAYQGVIAFEYNKADLGQDKTTLETLTGFKQFLAKHTEVSIEIQGHTDSRGSDQYNRELSDRRAASVRRWLVDNGIPEDRVTSVGKGEDAPQVPEPAACDDKVPSDATSCEKAWAINRRVVFKVTQGAETLATETGTATEAPATPPPAAIRDCPQLWGGHANALGPNSWFMLAGATQPGICWLELSLGVGVGFRNVDARANDGTTASADGRYVSFTIPLRGRFWFMDRHSLIGDLGLGFTHYRISAEFDNGAGLAGKYKRRTTPVIGHLGLGYGFRPNGVQAGPRFAVIVGGLIHLNKLGSSDLSADPAFVNAAVLQAAMDGKTDKLDDAEPYGELSFGWLW